MGAPTRKARPEPSYQAIKFSASVDDKGRISIPSYIVKIIEDESIILGYIFFTGWDFLPKIRVCSRNRISIPSFIRRTLAINSSDILEMTFAFQNKIFIMKNGRDGVKVNMPVLSNIEACGAFESGSNDLFLKRKSQPKEMKRFEIPDRGPVKKR